MLFGASGLLLFIVFHILLTSLDREQIHQGSWGWVGDVAGTAGSRTWVAGQSRGPGNAYRKVTYLNWAAPLYAYACGCVLAYANKRFTIRLYGLLFIIILFWAFYANITLCYSYTNFTYRYANISNWAQYTLTNLFCQLQLSVDFQIFLHTICLLFCHSLVLLSLLFASGVPKGMAQYDAITVFYYRTGDGPI